MRRLSRLLSRTSSSSQGPLHGDFAVETQKDIGLQLFDLPIEILLTVESYLQYENSLALSLTCKRLYDLFFVRPNGQHCGRDLHFLRLLERDTPSQIACPIHERLYDWNKQKSKRFSCPQCTSSKRSSSGSLVVCNKGCRSSFYGIFEAERRLILRHALLGPQYGINTRILDHVCKKSFSKRANEVRPRIVDGSLMLWRIHHYDARIDMKLPEAVSADLINEAICVHDSERGFCAILFACVDHVWRHRQSTSSKVWVCPILFKCSQCSTDARVYIERISADRIVIRYDVYQDLGSLEQLTVSQRQVLGAKDDWRQLSLSNSEKIQRFEEDLEARFYGEDRQDSQHKVKDVAFLSHWSYSQHYPGRSESIVRFRFGQVLQVDPRLRYSDLPFEVVDGTTT